MTSLRFALCQLTSARVICAADLSLSSSHSLVISHIELSTGSILPGLSSALQPYFTDILLLSKDSTHFFLLDTASKLAPTHSHPKSSPSRLHQGPCYSRPIALVFR